MRTNKSILLLRTLLLSTSPFNTLKYSKDKKKKNQIIGNFIGYGILFLCLMAYMLLTAIGNGMAGMAEVIPVSTAIIISMLGFILTLLKSNGYLFGFKEYDMLMAMPFEVKSIVACKFLYMYLKNIGWFMTASVAMMIGYGIFVKPSVFVYLIWIILSILLPIIPEVLASAIGVLIVKIGSAFKHKKAVQTILIFAFIMLCMGSRFWIEAIFRNGEAQDVLNDINHIADITGRYYRPAKWFSDAIVRMDLLAALLLMVVTVLVFIAFFTLVSKSYRSLNSKLAVGTARKDFKMQNNRTKQRSVVKAIAFKEMKRMTGSTTYMTNAAFGEVISVIIGVVVLFVKAEKVIEVVMQGAPVKPEMLWPALPLIVYFMIGMVATTCCSPSLEGKNYWIVQSMPIDKMDLYKGKMLFNLYLTVPVGIFCIIAWGISFRLDIIYMLLCIICEVVLCLFSTTFGMVTGLKHIKLEWENEIEVIKQGAAVAIYLMPNMFGGMILMVGTVVLGMVMDGRLVILILTVVMALLTLLCYRCVKNIANKN